MSKKVTKEFIPVFERMGQEQKNSLLLSASSCGDINLVANLLWHGAHVNVKNETSMTPLMAAVLNEKFEMASYLLEQDADANIAADDGKTPLLVATQKNNANLIRLLLAHRAKLNSQHIDRQKNIFGRGFDNLVIEKITPLMEAAARHNTDTGFLVSRDEAFYKQIHTLLSV